MPAERPEWEQVYRESAELLAKYRAATEHQDFTTIIRFGPNDGADPPLLTALLPDLSAHRGIVKQVLANGWRAEDGGVDPNAMMDSWATSLRSAGHLGQGSTLIEQFVGIAENYVTCEMARQALVQGVIPPEQLGTALRVLQENTPAQRDPAALISGELAFSLDLVQFATDPPGTTARPTSTRRRWPRSPRILGPTRRRRPRADSRSVEGPDGVGDVLPQLLFRDGGHDAEGVIRT